MRKFTQRSTMRSTNIQRPLLSPVGSLLNSPPPSLSNRRLHSTARSNPPHIPSPTLQIIFTLPPRSNPPAPLVSPTPIPTVTLVSLRLAQKSLTQMSVSNDLNTLWATIPAPNMAEKASALNTMPVQPLDSSQLVRELPAAGPRPMPRQTVTR